MKCQNSIIIIIIIIIIVIVIIIIIIIVCNCNNNYYLCLNLPYFALIYPYVTYGCILWGNNHEVPLSKTVKLQNKAIRIINNVPLHEHIIPHYAQLDLLKFPDFIKLNTCQFFYGHLCDYKSSNKLSYVSEQHNYNSKTAELQPLKRI